MTDDLGWDIAQLAARVARLEAWQRRVVGERPVPVPEPSALEVVVAACKAAGVPEATIEALRAEHGHDEEALIGYLQELAEEGDLRARARRGGIDLDRENEERR